MPPNSPSTATWNPPSDSQPCTRRAVRLFVGFRHGAARTRSFTRTFGSLLGFALSAPRVCWPTSPSTSTPQRPWQTFTALTSPPPNRSLSAIPNVAHSPGDVRSNHAFNCFFSAATAGPFAPLAEDPVVDDRPSAVAGRRPELRQAALHHPRQEHRRPALLRDSRRGVLAVRDVLPLRVLVREAPEVRGVDPARPVAEAVVALEDEQRAGHRPVAPQVEALLRERVGGARLPRERRAAGGRPAGRDAHRSRPERVAVVEVRREVPAALELVDDPDDVPRDACGSRSRLVSLAVLRDPVDELVDERLALGPYRARRPQALVVDAQVLREVHAHSSCVAAATDRPRQEAWEAARRRSGVLSDGTTTPRRFQDRAAKGYESRASSASVRSTSSTVL